MGSHINADGLFQSDKYPTCPAGKVPLSVKDVTAQDLLWRYAKRRRSVDAEFSDDLERCLVEAGFIPNCESCGALVKDGGHLCEVCTDMGVTEDDLTSTSKDF